MCFASFLTVQGVSTAFDAVPLAAAVPQVTSLFGNVVPFTSMKPIHPPRVPVAPKVVELTCCPNSRVHPVASLGKATIDPSANWYAR